MLVTNIVKRLEVPNEPDAWVEVRKLSWRQRDEAQNAMTDKMFDRMKKAGSDIVKALQGMAQAEQTGAREYDQGMVLRFGIVAWSYGVPVTPDTIDQLDEATATWLYSQIIELSTPTEDQRKNA